MPPSQRITIRLSPVLAARLAATAGPHGNLADIVRHAIEAYLEDKPVARQTWQPPAADTAARAAATTTARSPDVADTLAAIHTRLTGIEQRLSALEAVASGSQRQPEGQPPHDTPSPQLLGTYDPHAATARIQTLRRQGLSLIRIADMLTQEGIPTRYGKPWEHSSVRHLLKTYGEQ